jgi:hypothetical protein
MIQHGVLFAAHHEGEARQICKHGPGAILPIQPQQGALLRELLRSEGATDGPEGLAQFRPVEPVASVAKGVEPLVAVGLADDGAGTDDFPTLAPHVASSTDFLQPAKGRWQLFSLRQGALAGGLTRAIDIEDHPLEALSIHQTACLFLFRERAAEQIVEKQEAQGFDWLLCQSCQEAREGRAGWQPVTVPPRP